MNKMRFIALGAAGLTLALLVILGLRDIEQFRSGSRAGDGADGDVPVIRFVDSPQPVPQLNLTDLDGRPLNSADWRGKVVLINFWATWCGPCIAEIPDLIRLQEKYAGQFLVVGLSTDIDPPGKVKEFARQKGINYPVAMAGPDVEAKFGGVFGLPTSFVLDTQGRIVQKHIGLLDPASYELEIRALLNMPVNARVERFEDTGQVMLANASRAMEYPGVDLSKLNEQQKIAARRRINETECNCGCGLTVAQCLVHDSSCGTSKDLAAGIVEDLLGGGSSASPTAP